MARTPEQGHEPECYAAAIISVVETLRDSGLSVGEFRSFMQDNYPMHEADRMLKHGEIDCSCPDLPVVEYCKLTCHDGQECGARLNADGDCTAPGFHKVLVRD